MKVDYIKYSDERNKRFSIKTTVRSDSVYKEAVFPEGQSHIDRMLHTQKELKQYYPQVEVCKAWKEGKGISFEFVFGETMLEQYSKVLKDADVTAYENLLKTHRALICGGEENTCSFASSEAYVEWFGDATSYEGRRGLKYSNFDAIASNIIYRDENPVFIDYEWIMEFVMPEELVIFHCIKDSYIHIPELESFYPLKKAMELLGVTLAEEILEKSYQTFFTYVICDEEGRSYAKDKFLCLKHSQTVETVVREWENCANNWKAAVKANEEIYEQWQKALQVIENHENTISKLEQSYNKTIEAKVHRVVHKITGNAGDK